MAIRSLMADFKELAILVGLGRHSLGDRHQGTRLWDRHSQLLGQCGDSYVGCSSIS